jgi:drug/metabolite transporter (DMT)-like permease
LFLAIYNWPSFNFTSTNVLAGIYIGLFEMSVAFVFWLKAMSYAIRTAQISSLIYMSPFLSLLFINWILKEPIYTSTVVGLVVIVLGLFIQKKMNRNVN